MTGDGNAAQTTSSGWWPFPGMVFVLLATNIAVVSITAIYAASDDSYAVEPDYYRQAVNWDIAAAQRDQNRNLGWDVTMLPSISGGPITLRLRDSEGQPIVGARVSVIAFHNARANNRLNTSLIEIDAGMYRSTESLIRVGSWEVRLTAVRADESFTAIIGHQVLAKEQTP